MATPVEALLRKASTDLNALKVRWAIIGGLAVSARATPRFTRDLDLAVAGANDHQAKDLVLRLRERGYTPVEVLEQDYVERHSGVRLEHHGSTVIVDLLFASSGIEPEIVASATRVQVDPWLSVPVATIGHLIALKTLAGRNMDLVDLENLIPAASTADLDAARSAVKLIQARGFNRDEDLIADLEKLISEIRPKRSGVGRRPASAHP